MDAPWLLEAVGWAGSALLVFSLLQRDMKRLRVLNLIACVVLIGYNGWIGVWPMFAMNAALALINTYYLVVMRREARVQPEAATTP